MQTELRKVNIGLDVENDLYQVIVFTNVLASCLKITES